MRRAMWNVQSINNKLKEVVAELGKYRTDKAMLTEMKKKGSGNKNIGKYTCFWTGVKKSDRARAGVTTVIKRSLISRIIYFDFCIERLMTLTMKLYGREVCLMAAYTSTDDVLMSEKYSFFEAMTN
jgi:exonuclease III